MTERLYDRDAYMHTFDAVVLSCTAAGGRYAVVLDRTAFFPEQGGQYADPGTLDGVRVLDVQIKDGVITHLTEEPFPIGKTVAGCVDFAIRYDRMQNHTGEHILSGLIHTRFGYDNVGFHMNDTEMTVDVSGELTREQLNEIEAAVNRVIRMDLPVEIDYPLGEALHSLDYRSKLELTEDVRIVTIPGYDRCACCAPHVHRTGEVGLLKILDAIRYKGGMRLWVKCGERAISDYQMRHGATVSIANRLRVKQEDIVEAVARLEDRLSAQKAETEALRRELIAYRVRDMEETEGNLCLFLTEGDNDAMRAMANAGAEKCGGICGVFLGNDASGYRFVIASRAMPLKGHSKAITAALDGRGGGSDQMLSGTAGANEATIRTFFADWKPNP